MKILVTGGAGFIGSNFIRGTLERHPDWEVVNLDKLTYAGNPENLKTVAENPRYHFVQGDVADPGQVAQALSGCAQIVHFASETHVDRSITHAAEFIQTNVLGTQVLLEGARTAGIERFLMVSTDEVYGSLSEGAADENGLISPNSPYAASKAAADHLTRAYFVTYGLPTLTVRATNNFGPYQFPEKFLPLLITNALEDKPLPLYGDGAYVREWLYVEDCCQAIEQVLTQGQTGQVYNIGSGDHRVNLDVAKQVLELMGKPARLLTHVKDRPGHDRRYAVVSEKIRALGWKPAHSFESALKATIQWYQAHPDWWGPLKERAKVARCPHHLRL
jgi:dTDP-glucose 4,6-dehydratase